MPDSARPCQWPENPLTEPLTEPFPSPRSQHQEPPDPLSEPRIPNPPNPAVTRGTVALHSYYHKPLQLGTPVKEKNYQHRVIFYDPTRNFEYFSMILVENQRFSWNNDVARRI